MSRKKKVTIAVAVCVIIYSLVGFIAIPLILEYMLPDKLSEALHRTVRIENISLNPFALTATVEGFTIQDKNPADPFVSFDKLFVNVQTLSLFKWGLVIKEVRLEKPDIHIARTSETEFNFSDLIPAKEAGKKPEKKANKTESGDKAFHFSISNIAIIDGNILFQDDPVREKHVLSGINFKLPHISNFDAQTATHSEILLTGDFNQAGLSIDMDTKPFHDSLETSANLSLSGLAIPYYFVYVPKNRVGFKITNGQLDVDARIAFIDKDDHPELTVDGTIRLAGLEILENSGSTLLKLPELKIDVAPSRLLAHQLTLASVKIQSPELSVSRNSDGIINLTTLVAKPAETAGDAEPTSTETTSESTATATAPDKPFILRIEDLLLDNGKIVYTDFAAAKKPTPQHLDAAPIEISVDDLEIKVTDFTNEPEKTASYDIHAMINKEAAIATTGRLGITPLSVESDYSLENVKLAWGQPYIPENIRLQVTNGLFFASGHASASTTSKGDIQTAITGKAAVREFAVMDKDDNGPFISWKDFAFDGIDVTTHPVNINLNKIQLNDFKSHIMVFKDGATNISKIIVKSPEESKTAEEKTAKPESAASESVVPVKIGEVTLKNFDVAFTDNSVTPNFSTHMNLADLRVTGLTSEDFKAADLNAEGKIDDYAPFKIKGAINPLKKDLFLDLTYRLSDMDLSPLSPYTGKYIGRTIQKGKLSTDVAYKIDKKVINADNRILLDQFTLGQAVDSKDALNLPVGLAISLLKDRNGEISVDLPISGRTDDPDFGFGKPLLKALQNLIVKAATSPFDLVSSVVAGGEGLRYIEFTPAVAVVDDTAAKKLDAIKKLMYERPILKLDIAGYVDPDADTKELAALMLTRKIKAETLGKNAKKDTEAIDAVVLSPEEYQKLLKKMYIKDLLSDPGKKKALKPVDDPTLTNKEMASALQSGIPVTEDALTRLALERAQAVKDYLLKDQSISPDRVFLTKPPTLSPEKTEKFKAARVELNVR